MAGEVLHIVFSEAGAENVRNALEKASRRDEVAGMPDCLSLGPINPPDLQTRQAWLEQELTGNGYEDVYARTELFWNKVLTDKKPKVLWVSRRCAADYAGFLEAVWRLDGAPCSVIDVTDAAIVLNDPKTGATKRWLSLLGLVVMTEDYIVKSGLFDQAQPLTEERAKEYRGIWKRLREENAPFRIVNEKGIASAPVTHFDKSLLSFVTTAWQTSGQVAGAALTSVMNDDYFQLDMQGAILFARLQKLSANGLIETRGDVLQVNGEVRLRQVKK